MSRLRELARASIHRTGLLEALSTSCPSAQTKNGARAGEAARPRLLANWQLNGIVTMQTGQPYTIALPGEFDNSNTGRSSYGFGAGDRPDVTGDPNLAQPDPQQWF